MKDNVATSTCIDGSDPQRKRCIFGLLCGTIICFSCCLVLIAYTMLLLFDSARRSQQELMFRVQRVASEGAAGGTIIHLLMGTWLGLLPADHRHRRQRCRGGTETWLRLLFLLARRG